MRYVRLLTLLVAVAAQLCPVLGQRGLIDDLAGIAWNRKFGHLQKEGENKYRELVDGTVGAAKAGGGLGIYYVDPDGRTPLHWAAANGYDEMVQALLNAGASVDAGCLFADQSPLFLACSKDFRAPSRQKVAVWTKTDHATKLQDGDD